MIENRTPRECGGKERVRQLETKRIETVSLIGLGALGSAYLGKIAQTLPVENIRVIADGPRAERYRQHGVRINGEVMRYPVCEPAQPVEPADLLIFAVKYGQLAQAIEQARGHVGADTIVISLLNGIDSEEQLAGAFGWDRVLYALSLGIDATRAGDETRCSTTGQIPFGEARNIPGRYSERVLRLEEFFRRVGLGYTIPEDMLQSLWNKFMINVGTNQLSAILRAPYGVFQKSAAVRELALAAMAEVVALSRAEGVNLPDSAPQEGLAVIDRLSPTGKTSMLQDMEAGRKTEVVIFGGAVVSLGRKHGLPTPVNDMLVRLVHGLEEMVDIQRAYEYTS